MLKRESSCTSNTNNSNNNNNNNNNYRSSSTTTTTSTTTTSTSSRWAHRRPLLKGVAMTAGTNNQKTPLVKIEMQRPRPSADMVHRHLKQDNEEAMKQMLQSWDIADVLRPEPDGQVAGTSLHTAVTCGAEKCLKVMLSHRPPKKELEAPGDKGRTALLTAVGNAQHAALSHLLVAGANVNARDDNHIGALHLLVMKLSKDSAQAEDLLKVADCLLSSTHVDKLDLEPHAHFADLTAATPLALATAKLQKEDRAPWVTNLVELCKKLVKAGASLSEDVNGATVQQVLTQKGWLTNELLRERRQPPARPTEAHVVDLVCMSRSGSEVRELLQGKKPEDAREAVNSNIGSSSLLSYAVTITDTSLVEELLKYGANPWLLEVTKELPLHRAAAKGHVEIFKALVKKMKGNNKTIDLQSHSVSLIKKLMQSSDIKTEDRMACLRHLLQEAKLDLNQKDPDLTSLHWAAKYDQQDAVSELLRAGAFLGARHVEFKTDCGAALDNILPETLEHAMDGCITHYKTDDKKTDNNEIENVFSEHYTLHLDYRCLLPPTQDDTNIDSKPVNEVETLMEVCNSTRHRHLIKHPLVQTLLYAKWKKVKLLYIFNLALYLFFVVMLTTFAYFLKDVRVTEERLSFLQNNGTINTTSLEASLQRKQISMYVFMVLLLLASLFMCVRMVLQMFSFKYLKKIENWLQWFLLVMVPVLCFVPLATDCIRQLAAWTMVIAWFVFVLKLGRMPFFSLYITMLRHVTSNFLKLIILYSLLILAFTLSFIMLLYQPSRENSGENQNEALLWFPKAVIMSTGEFEYSGMSEEFPDSLKISAIFMTLLFVFAIFLVLMNVMNALAVTDAQQVVNDTKLYSLISLLELLNTIEAFFSRPVLRSRLGNLQLLSGPNNAPSFLAKINLPKKHERLLSGLSHKTPNKLNDEHAECLRIYWLQRLEEKKSQRRAQAVGELENAVHNLAADHPDLLRSLAAALRPGQ